MENFIKILCSIPVILLVLYFIPFLGVILLITRYFVFQKKKVLNGLILVLVFAFIILIPKILYMIFDLIKYDYTNIPYFNDIISSSIYNDFLSYSKLLIIVGIVFLIISFLFNKLIEKVFSYLRSYIQKQDAKEERIMEKNNLLMQEKRERAKNTHVVKCPYCGADNMLTEKHGTCKFCRRHI